MTFLRTIFDNLLTAIILLCLLTVAAICGICFYIYLLFTRAKS